ncbi:MAG TPA: hypothetical protein VHF69_04070, partial [Candidatus Synoicihabitans sp.]|nr:hypothetical protein [Candidatus Synoicihabitans sp.]
MARDSEPDELGPFQFAVFLLSLALLVGLAADWFFSLPREVERLIFFVDTTICGVLFTDFLVRWKAARWRPSFMKWGWIDLLASVPAVDVLRFGRVLRIVRVIRMIVAIRSLRRFVEILW